ncbi:hypothetical protein KGQ34_02680, partial [Patescibacteria group bacterium]|nr:hypothetical protein [Patescibacteria group bacterium]
MKNIFKLVITERVITIIGAAFIFFQMFFSFTAFAATPKPDLTAVKSNNVGGNALVGTNTFTWQIHIANSGAATASWGNNKTVFQD